MSKIYTLDEFVPEADSIFESDGEALIIAEGNEMFPIIRESKDYILLKKPDRKFAKDDIVLYRSENGDSFVRRVVYVNGDTYVVSGDYESVNEYNISDDRIIGLVASYERNGKTHTVDDKNYGYYLKALPVIKVILQGYKWIKERLIDFISFLKRR